MIVSTAPNLPVDIDILAMRFARGIDIDDLPGDWPALTINGRIILRRGLARCDERWHGAHELYHAIMGGSDQRPYMGTKDPVLTVEEAAADRFRFEILVPGWELIERLEAGEAIEELAIDYGLTVEHMAEAAIAAYADRRRMF